MGKLTGLILDGVICEDCGIFITKNPPGNPQRCDGCIEVEETLGVCVECGRLNKLDDMVTDSNGYKLCLRAVCE